MALKLGKLPDRTPVKLTLSVTPELHCSLKEYAAVYRQTYGESTKIEDLAPMMLEGFLNSDTGFRRARKTLTQQRPTTE